MVALLQPVNYFGDIVTGVLSISPAVTFTRVNGTVPCYVQVSVENTVGAGVSRIWQMIEYRHNFGDTTPVDQITHPNYVGTVDPNNCQVGPIAAYVYRTAGTYIHTLTCRCWNGTRFVSNSIQTTITVTAFAGTTKYYDSVAGTAGGTGTIGDPSNDIAAAFSFVVGGDNRQILLKEGSTFLRTTALTFNPGNVTRTNCRIDSYAGNGVKPIIQANTGFTPANTGNLISANVNNAAMHFTDVVVSNVDFDGNELVKNTINLLTTVTGDFSFMYFDRCLFRGANTNDGSRCFNISTSTTGVNKVGWWRCTFDGESSAEIGSSIEINGADILHFGCFFQGGGTAVTVDSLTDHYLYPSKLSRWLFSHCYFNIVGGNYGYCINGNGDVTGSGGAVLSGHWLITDSYFSGTRHAIDISANNNNSNQGTIDKVLIRRCKFDTIGKMVDSINTGCSILLYYSGIEVCLSHCDIVRCVPSFGNGSDYIRNAVDGTQLSSGEVINYDLRTYCNRIYMPATLHANRRWLKVDKSNNVHTGMHRDNIIVDERAIAVLAEIEFTDTGIQFQNNFIFAPSSSTLTFEDDTDNSTKTEAEFKAVFGASSLTFANSAYSGWSSPSTGLFELANIKATRNSDTTYDVIALGQSFAAAGTPFDLGEVASEQFYIHNPSNQIIIVSSFAVTQYGSSPAGLVDTILNPFESTDFSVLYNTAGNGNFTATVSIASNDAASPFIFHIDFDSGGVSVPAGGGGNTLTRTICETVIEAMMLKLRELA